MSLLRALYPGGEQGHLDAHLKLDALPRMSAGAWANRPGAPEKGELYFATDRGALYYYSKGEFSYSTFDGWYLADRGLMDTFTRADSATTAGSPEYGFGPYVPAASAVLPGINSNQFYFASDANADKCYTETLTANPTLEIKMSGDLNDGGGNFRIPGVLFRLVDGDNALRVELTTGIVRLQKVDTAIETTLASIATTTTDGVTYTVNITCTGNSMTVYVDGVSKFTHTLAASNFKYLAYSKAGMWLLKGGVPTSNARWDGLLLRQAA